MDEVFKSEVSYQEHTDELVHKLTQPSEDIILERNAELRKNEGALNDLGAKSEGGSWGRQIASIPLILYHKAIKDGYDLNNRDPKIAEKELFRFLKSPEGQTCLVGGKLHG